MPDLLDRILADFSAEQVKASSALIKTPNGFAVHAASDLDALFGELALVEQRDMEIDGQKSQVPVYEQRVSAEDVAAQATRAETFKIAAKDDGAVLKPKALAEVADEDFGDPTNYRLALHTPDAVKAARAAWDHDTARAPYTDAEKEVIGARITAAEAKHGTAPAPDPGSGTATKSTLTIGSDTFDMTEEHDGLGRTTYRFTVGNPGADKVSFGLVHRGTLAWLEAPKETSHEDMQRMLGALSMHKAATPQKKQGTFADALQDAYESAGVGALSSGWWAFLSTVTDYWDGTFEDIDVATYQDCVDQLADYLKQTWTKFNEGESTQASLTAAAMDALKLMKRGATATGQKAGASISRANRERLEAAQAALNDVLGVTASTDDDGDTSGKSAAKHKGISGAAGAIPPPEADVALMRKGMAELKEVKDRQKRIEAENADLRSKLTESERLLQQYGQLPQRDPLDKKADDAPNVTDDGEHGDPYSNYGYLDRVKTAGKYGGF